MTERVKRRLEAHLKAAAEETLLRGQGITTLGSVLEARCPTGLHVLHAGVGFLRVGRMWFDVRDEDLEDELFPELPVVQCVDFGVRSCGGPREPTKLVMENIAEEKRILEAIRRKGMS